MTPHLVSCLCVTEKRHAFMPWLWWNFAKQSYPHLELVVIDSSPKPWDASWVIPMEPGANVPQKRNRALAEARGELIVWFDDDDWHHPEHVARVQAALGGEWCAGPIQAWWINLLTLECRRAGAARRPQFDGAIFRKSALEGVRFDEQQRVASDARWMRALVEKHGKGRLMPDERDLVAWLNHTQNISNPAGKHKCHDPLSVLREAVGAADWGGTDQQLLELRKRLGLHK